MDKKQIKKSLKLYAITDRSRLKNKSLAQAVEECIKGGATILQVREKNISEEEFVKIAGEIKILTRRYKIPLIINDSVKVAALTDADGVHVGQDDENVAEVKKVLGEGKIVGVSVNNLKEAMQAQSQGADYLGVGAVFYTGTKDDADSVSLETLKQICHQTDIPVVAIGGINETNLMELEGSGVDGICVVSAIFSKEDIFESTKKIRKLCDAVVFE